MLKRKLYLDKIRTLIDKDIIKVITGIRRCGKSYLLKQIKDELLLKGINNDQIHLISFESLKYKHIKTGEELDKLVLDIAKDTTKKMYLLFDEIQNVKNWEQSINAYKTDLNCDLYITGSNSKLLSGELATLISGRYIEIKMYPFSYNELLEYKRIINSKDNEDEIFNEYLEYGGLPQIYTFNENDRINYINDIYNSIILKDIIERNNVRNIDLLNILIEYFIDNIGHTFSSKNTINYLKHEKRNISNETLYNYIQYCIDSCFINKIRRMDLQGKRLMKKQEKYYLTDHSFLKILGNNQKNIGSTLENIIYIELLRRGYDVKVGKKQDLEIDFICTKNDKKVYIQVTYLLANEDIINREFTPLMKIRDNYPKYVLSLDDYDFSNQGIKHLNIKNFLINGDI